MSSGRIYLLDDAGNFAALFDAYDSCVWVRRFWEPGELTLKINRYVQNADLLDSDRVLLVEDNRPGDTKVLLPFIIEDIRAESGPEGRTSEILEVVAVEYGFHDQRICLPGPYDVPLTDAEDSFSSEPAETAMIALVDHNVGPSAVSERKLDDLTVDTDGGRGAVGDYNARFQLLSERLKAIGTVGGIGWEVAFDAPNFLFRCLPGVDRTATVVLDQAFDSVQAEEWLHSLKDYKTVAYVAGQGESDLRTVVKTWLGVTEPTGRDRREMFIDARDIPNDGSEAATLAQRGMEKLAEQQIADTFTVEVNALGSFQYRRDWDLGDTVTVRNPRLEIERTARIVEVTQQRSSGQADAISVALGRAIPTIRDRVLQEIGSAGSARA